MRDQPCKERRILRDRKIACQCLEEVMVCVDQPRQHDHSARIDRHVGARRQTVARTDVLDDAVARKDSAVFKRPIGVIEGREQVCMAQEKRRHSEDGPDAERAMTIADLNTAERAWFVAAVGFAFESSPWIAELASERRPFSDLDALTACMNAIVAESPLDRRLALIAAHPDLAGRVAREGRLTPASTDEQASAGLDRLTPAEAARFETLNAAYRDRFGFPFVICVREQTKSSILE